MPGERGPVPKRSDQRRRRNQPEAGEPAVAPGAAEVEQPDPDESWHPVALAWYRSLGESGQSHFYQPSDWHTAYLLAESMSRELKPQPLVVGEGEDQRVEMVTLPPKAGSLTAWLKGMSVLLVSEGDRRRAGVELQVGHAVNDDPEVPNIDDFRDRLSG